MFSAAYRIFGFCLVLVGAGGVECARGAPRSRSPAAGPAGGDSASASAARAAPLAFKKIGGLEYVSVAEVAAQLDLKMAWVDRGRKLALTGRSVRAELENDTRDIVVNGLRVFLGDPVVDAGRQLYVSRVDFERCLTPLLRPGYGVPPRPAPKVIVLDPGHGGKDQGTSQNEKTFALDVARRARKVLERAGHRVVLTRDSDEYLSVPQRPVIANANKADLFVSIHFNAVARDSNTSGFEIYTFAPQFQRSAKSWSPGEGNDTENEAAPVNRYDHWSVVLAQAIHRRFVSDVKTFDRGKKLMHLGALRSLNCPGVLVECGFLTSEVEARKIGTPAYRQKLAEAIAAGIREYAAVLEPFQAKASAASIKSKRPVISNN